jgi:hypothetical protein
MLTRRRRTLVRAGAFAVLAVLLSACIKLDMNLTVASDNTVSGTVIFALNKQLIELSGQSADDLLGSTAPVPSGVQGVDTAPYEDDQFQGQKFTFDAVPLAQFNQENGDADQLRISRQGNTFTVTGALDLSSAGGGSGATGLSGFPGADEIFKSAQLKITLTFPGTVKSSNGQVNGNTVTWVPKVGERLELHATANAIGSGGGSSSSSTTMLLIIAAVVVVAAIVVGILVARRRQPTVAGAGAGGGDGDGAGAISGGDMGTAAPPTAPPPPPGDTPPPPPPPGDPQP